MKFITNKKSLNHQTVLSDNFQLYDEVYIAVAFLKVSGLNLIIQRINEFLKLGGKIIIITGQDFGITEPEALWTLEQIFKANPTSKLYLANKKSTSTFHPKLYLFKSNKDCCVISGSANMTAGGLQNNQESSLIFDCIETETIWVEAKKYFDSLLSNENSVEASFLSILQYEKDFKELQPINKALRSISYKKRAKIEFSNYDALRKHFNKYDNKKREEIYSDRLSSYHSAKRILDKIATDKKLNKKVFKELLDELVGGSPDHFSYWHSGGLSRGKTGKADTTGVYDHWKEFQKLVKFIKTNINKNEDYLFENGKVILKTIYGAGINYLTEILMTYDRNRFANMNKNPLTVLTGEAGVEIKKSPSSYNGKDYKEYCVLIKEISQELGLRDMLEADSFFNVIYWKGKKKLKK